MDQSTISQFFVARKNSFSASLPPAKRVKFDETNIVKTESIKRCSKTTMPTRARSTRNSKSSKKALAKTPEIAPRNFFRQPDEKVLEKDVNGKKLFDIGTTETIKKVTGGKTLPKPQLSFDDTTDDQLTKKILLSRGSAMLKAGYDRNLLKSPSKASDILNLLSPKKNTSGVDKISIIGSPSKLKSPFKSPSKLSEVLKSLTPKKEEITKTVDTITLNVDAPKILTEPATATVAATSTASEGATSSTTARRERLRNKFKHLLKQPEPEVSTVKVKEVESAKNVEVTAKEATKNVVAQEVKEVSKEVTKEAPVESGPSKLKAHEKFKHLAEKIKPTPSSFVLPNKYKLLIEMFRCVDSILFLLNQRSELCTFKKLKNSVQTMCSRNFELEHLAKIKTIYPTGFIFRQEKGLFSSAGSSNSYQLTVEANFKDTMTNSTKLTSNVLITRRLKFENYLLMHTKEHHQKFLRKLNIKLADSEIHRWHPNFKVNDVPDIEESSLPRAPIVKEFKNAADLIRNSRNLAPKVHNALSNVANKEGSQDTDSQSESEKNISKTNSSSTTNIEKPATTKNTNTKLKGVSSSLLERIRQKEQKNIQLAMTRDPEKEEKLSKMQRLPEVCRMLKSYFTTEKKAAITLEDCVNKLSESYGTSMSQVKLEEHVRLLSDLVPDWLTIAMVRKFPFVKLAKNYDINEVINSLNTIRTNEMEKS